MSRWGNAKPRDMVTPVPVFNRSQPFKFKHDGRLLDVPSGTSMQDPHVADRLVLKRRGDLFYGTHDPNVVREPEVVPEVMAVEPETRPETIPVETEEEKSN